MTSESTSATASSSSSSGLAERWKERLEESEHGLWTIGVASFLEATVVPIPLELVLIPFLLARPKQLGRISTVVLVGCVLGALAGYAIGLFLMQTVGERIVEAMGWSSGLEEFRAALEENGFWAIVGIGVTPVPFQVAMIGAGAAQYPIALFVLATALARGVRYYGLALLVKIAGRRAERLWDEHSTAVGVGILAVAAVAVTWTFVG